MLFSQVFESVEGCDYEDDKNEEELDGTGTLAMFDEESDYPSSRDSTPDPIKLDPSPPPDLLSSPPTVMISSSLRGRRQPTDNNPRPKKRTPHSPTQLEIPASDRVTRSTKKQRKTAIPE